MKRKPQAPVPTEHQEQVMLCQWLDLYGIRYAAIPNGARVRPSQARKLKAEGMRPGAPDLVLLSRLVINAPPDRPGDWTEPVAIEMKRAKGGRVSTEQEAVHAGMRANGWTVIVARGASDAVAQLAALGYGSRAV